MRCAGFDTIYGADGEHRTPYMTRIWIGRLRLHVFHRGDADPDCHDHPWDFWTFPLTSYVEEITLPNRFDGGYTLHRQVVSAGRWSFRPAEHMHRVLGRFDEWETLALASGAFIAGSGRVDPQIGPGRIVTIVWQGRERRRWGFLKNRDGQWCWTPWRDYVFGGGKRAACEPSDTGGQP